MSTARDANGEAAVLWTFYPPDEEWSVSVSPTLPAGLDAARWELRLIRIVSQDGEHEITRPAAASAAISPCAGWVFYFQLVDKGAVPATP
jgi:hypothetical protein